MWISLLFGHIAIIDRSAFHAKHEMPSACVVSCCWIVFISATNQNFWVIQKIERVRFWVSSSKSLNYRADSECDEHMSGSDYCRFNSWVFTTEGNKLGKEALRNSTLLDDQILSFSSMNTELQQTAETSLYPAAAVNCNGLSFTRIKNQQIIANSD